MVKYQLPSQGRKRLLRPSRKACHSKHAYSTVSELDLSSQIQMDGAIPRSIARALSCMPYMRRFRIDFYLTTTVFTCSPSIKNLKDSEAVSH